MTSRFNFKLVINEKEDCMSEDLKRSVDDRMKECRSGDDEGIFEEYGANTGPMSIEEVADYIVDVVMDCDYYRETEWCEFDDGTKAFVLVAKQYREDRKDPKHVVKAWNSKMRCNGETHGTIFTALHKNGEYEFLDELMNDLNNDFDWDT